MCSSIKLPMHWKISSNEIYAGCHWTKRNNHKTNYRQAYVGLLSKLDRVKNKVDIVIDYHFKKNALDSDNCSYMTKLLIDCLIKAEIIKNDSPNYVGYVSQRSAKGKDDCILLTIKESND